MKITVIERQFSHHDPYISVSISLVSLLSLSSSPSCEVRQVSKVLHHYRDEKEMTFINMQNIRTMYTVERPSLLKGRRQVKWRTGKSGNLGCCH